MDGGLLDLGLFLVTTFAAAFVAGLAGFAFGLVAAAGWLYLMPPAQAASLIVAFGLIVQGAAIWKLRTAIDWGKLWPFLAGTMVGVPLGVGLLSWSNPDHVRAAIGFLLVAYSLYAWIKPPLKAMAHAGPMADAVVGGINGALGGLTGLAGIVVTIWSGTRGWPRDHQRAVFQPIAVATFAISAIWLGLHGAVTAPAVQLFVLGLPTLLLGTWLGLRLYGRLHEAGFRKTILTVLFLSGIGLILR